jgi:ATP-dependent RNA helicase DeaD
MLRMGFIDDVETVLKKTPETRQVALFSATMPAPIRRIAQTYLRNPVEIAIKSKTTTVASVRQRFWYVSGLHKLDALTRILEAEPFEAMIVFARTKQATEELAEKLAARGFSAAAINGDVAQPMRERTIARLKDGQLDILVATDVAARGLDVERISHVLNYDIPTDTESYVHRIGRTGRAGRSGEAILFVTPREKGLLRAIERATRQPIEEMSLPSIETVNDTRVNKFLSRITGALGAGGLDMFRALVERYEREQNVPAIEVAAALAKLLQGDAPLLLEPPKREARPAPESRFSQREARPAPESRFSPRGKAAERREYSEPGTRPPPRADHGAERGASPPRGAKTREAPESGMETFRIEVGHTHGVQPGNIVGAIANEAGIDAVHIGRIDIFDSHSTVDLPAGMPSDVYRRLRKAWVCGQQLAISVDSGDDGPKRPPPGVKSKRKKFDKKRGAAHG